jgi:hypothetical protein
MSVWHILLFGKRILLKVGIAMHDFSSIISHSTLEISYNHLSLLNPPIPLYTFNSLTPAFLIYS